MVELSNVHCDRKHVRRRFLRIVTVVYRFQPGSSFKVQIITEFKSVKRDSDKNKLASLLKEYDDILKGIGKVTDFEHKRSITLTSNLSVNT